MNGDGGDLRWEYCGLLNLFPIGICIELFFDDKKLIRGLQ